MSFLNQTAFAPACSIEELSFVEIDQIDGARKIGSVSSDAVFAAGVAIGLASAATGDPVGVVVGILLVGWGLAE